MKDVYVSRDIEYYNDGVFNIQHGKIHLRKENSGHEQLSQGMGFFKNSRWFCPSCTDCPNYYYDPECECGGIIHYERLLSSGREVFICDKCLLGFKAIRASHDSFYTKSLIPIFNTDNDDELQYYQWLYNIISVVDRGWKQTFPNSEWSFNGHWEYVEMNAVCGDPVPWARLPLSETTFSYVARTVDITQEDAFLWKTKRFWEEEDWEGLQKLWEKYCSDKAWCFNVDREYAKYLST